MRSTWAVSHASTKRSSIYSGGGRRPPPRCDVVRSPHICRTVRAQEAHPPFVARHASAGERIGASGGPRSQAIPLLPGTGPPPLQPGVHPDRGGRPSPVARPRPDRRPHQSGPPLNGLARVGLHARGAPAECPDCAAGAVSVATPGAPAPGVGGLPASRRYIAKRRRSHWRLPGRRPSSGHRRTIGRLHGASCGPSGWTPCKRVRRLTPPKSGLTNASPL